MAKEVLDDIEDHVNSVRTEWTVAREKWFHGERVDPVFEGMVRDFCTFDGNMQAVHAKAATFMKGVEQFASGLTSLCDGVSAGLARVQDHQIASESCKMREAALQIARADAPHSALAKLRRDLQFNIVTPVQNHINNNRTLKASLEMRRRRLLELQAAQVQFDGCVKKGLSLSDRRYLQAKSALESARMAFVDVDRHVFEWLYILEEYRGDILDSTLQTLKYLQYEFFATSAHSLSGSLPERIEFRPMVEMTPEHLEAQVQMELQENPEENPDVDIFDFSTRLIDKKTREEPPEKAEPALPVDPLSLSSLMMQGFDEGPARRALRLHQNDTQAALDWLVDGGTDDVATQKARGPSDGVRMPTTTRRVQRLKAMRKAQQQKLREQREGKKQAEAGEKPGESSEEEPADQARAEAHRVQDVGQGANDLAAHQPPADLLELPADAPTGPQDLLGMEEVVAPTAAPAAASLLDLDGGMAAAEVMPEAPVPSSAQLLEAAWALQAVSPPAPLQSADLPLPSAAAPSLGLAPTQATKGSPNAEPRDPFADLAGLG